MKRQRGFTLIEILVAMAIFAVIALISYRTLSSLFEVREHLQKQSGRLRDTALFFARLDSDLSGLLDRETITADGLRAHPLVLTASPQYADDAALSFSRTGFADIDGLVGAPQRVGYRLKDGKIEWLLWSGLDQAPRSAPTAYAALSGVQDVAWRAVDVGGSPLDRWPQPGREKEPFPAGLQLTITLTGGEVVSRTIALRHD